MSPTTTARRVARETARVWRTIESMVADSVLGSPYTVISTESPTSRMSTPAASSRAAVGASYAVSIAIRSCPLAAISRGIERGSVSGRINIFALLASRSTSRGSGIAADQGDGGIITLSSRARRYAPRGDGLRPSPRDAAGGHVVLHPPAGLLDLRDQVLEVRRLVDEVDLVGVDDEERRLLVVVEVVVVGLDQLRQVLGRHRLLE